MHPEAIILRDLTVYPLLFIALLIAHELKIFHMAVVIVLAAMAALAERMSERWNEAKKEIE